MTKMECYEAFDRDEEKGKKIEKQRRDALKREREADARSERKERFRK